MRRGSVPRGWFAMLPVAVVATALSACLPGPDPGSGQEPGNDPGTRPVPHQSFVSRPDLLPPAVRLTEGPAWSDEHGRAGEFTFLTPNYGSETPSDGAVILDARGELVWMSPSREDVKDDEYFDLRVQEYRGEPVLTVYQGTSDQGRGDGEILVLDESYEEIARVTTGGSLGPGQADFHDSTITPEGTMLIGAYVVTPADLGEVGGPRDGYVEDAVIQEVDIATGEVRFEWSALDHVPLTETVLDFAREQAEVAEEAADEGIEAPQLGTRDEPFDYFHINSIAEDRDGALLVSARHTNAIYRIDRGTGEVDWTLGGSASDFRMGEGAPFTWQHDARRAPDGTLTLLDNHAGGHEDDASSRGLRLALDEEAMTAEVVTEYLPPAERKASSMANAQQLPNGNMHIGWGARPSYSEYTPDGELIYDVCHGDECYGEGYEGGGGSYRAYAFAWEGRPASDPDVVVREEDGGRVAYASWNGATEVVQWRLLAGEDRAGAVERTTADRDGFETAIPVTGGDPYLVVEALDTDGQVLGTATPVAGPDD
ncbi:MAG: arylsulfotransferase family protein [Citricoccus sp.]|nr:arylsulfotransferase family protein [Citricoccus sp. WCRC_4]